MSEIVRMVDQLQRAQEGHAWHGPSLREALDSVSAATVSSRPVPGAHSIWEIVLHIAAWEDAVRRRIEGELVELTQAEDWPAVTPTGETDWKAALAKLALGSRRLRESVTRYDPMRLDEKPGGNRENAYTLIHGVVQHDIYHAAQIVLLRKTAAR